MGIRRDAIAEPSLSDLRAALIAVYGTDYGIHSPASIFRFTDAARHAVSYRKGRVLVAGDAAHVHPPDGGQGLQTGVQDAVNLGWKLAQVVKGIAPEISSIPTTPSFAAKMSGLDIHYEPGKGHPLLGRRMPDLDLVTESGPLRMFTLLHDARPILLNLDAPGGFDITPWSDRVKRVDARYAGAWELPALGPVAAPSAVLTWAC